MKWIHTIRSRGVQQHLIEKVRLRLRLWGRDGGQWKSWTGENHRKLCIEQVLSRAAHCVSLRYVSLNLHAFCEEETVGFMSLHNLPEAPQGGSKRNGIS